MRKTWLCMVLTAALMITGCKTAAPQPESRPTTPEPPLQQVIDQLAGQFELELAVPLDQALLEDLLKLKPEDVEEYAGQLSMSMVSSDQILAIRPAPKKLEKVEKALEERLDFVRLAFEQYLPDQYEKAKAGSVVTQGGCVFLVIVGREGKSPAEEMALALETIDNIFNPELTVRSTISS